MFKASIACVFLVLLYATASIQNVASTTRARVIERTIHIIPPPPHESRYQYIPFDVAPSTRKITISYKYDRAYGANTLDIGLFDQRFTQQAGNLNGFRGWSGGRRSEFFVSGESATPGYLPGNIRPGTWHIILGVYQVAPTGVDVTLKIELERDEGKKTNLAIATPLSQLSKTRSETPRLAEREARSPKKVSILPHWVTGDLHMHTVHSDGDWTIPQLIAAADEAGLDFIAITDHNTNSNHTEIDRLANRTRTLVIRGEEITTYGGHANAWGLPRQGLIDFRVTPGDRDAMVRAIDQAHARGALISINHPFGICAGCVWGYDHDASGFDAIEVWNGSWNAGDELAMGFWDGLLQKGRRITAIASSDSHRAANPLGQAATHVAISGEVSVASVLRSIRAGRVYLTSMPTSPVVTFEAQSVGDRRTYFSGDVVRFTGPSRIRLKIAVADLPLKATISLISDGKPVRTMQSDETGAFPLVKIELNIEHQRYFRLEVRDQSGNMLALTNPIYVVRGAQR
jgi:hypothetical protein